MSQRKLDTVLRTTSSPNRAPIWKRLSSEMLTLYYNGLDVYQLSHCGEVSVAVQDWWELVCALNPTFWIPEFADNAENLYDIIRTWGDDDATFRRWRNILERYIKKTNDPRKRASFLNSLLDKDLGHVLSH